MKILYQRILFNIVIINLFLKNCYLYYELWSGIDIIKRYQETKNYIQHKIVRVMIDKKIKGEFIIDISQANIFNRFHRNLETVLKTLTFLKDIVQLSKFNAQKMSKCQYNKSLFVKKIKFNPNQNKESFDAQNY